MQRKLRCKYRDRQCDWLSLRYKVLGYGLTEPVDAWVEAGFELVTRTLPLRATPPIDECSVFTLSTA